MRCTTCDRKTIKGFRIFITNSADGTHLGLLCPACADTYEPLGTERLYRDGKLLKESPFDEWKFKVMASLRDFELDESHLPSTQSLLASFSLKMPAREVAWAIAKKRLRLSMLREF